MANLISGAFSGWNTETKQNNFNFLRLFFATAVIFSHSRPLLYGLPYLDPLGVALANQVDQLGDHPIDSGHIAVYGFFVISGYLISMSWHRSPVLFDYFRKRALRIFPAFLSAVALCVLLFGPMGVDHPQMYWRGVLESSGRVLLSALNLTVDWNRIPFINTLASVPFPHIVDGSLWTIRYEFLCYMAVAFFGLSARKLSTIIPRRFIRTGPAVLFLGVYLFYVGRLHGHLGALAWHVENWKPTAFIFGGFSNFPRLFVYFVAGMCIYAYRSAISFSWMFAGAAMAVLIASALIPGALPLTLPLCAPYLILAFAFAPMVRLAWVGEKNDLSYGIYLYAFPVQQLLIYATGDILTPLTLFLGVYRQLYYSHG